MKLIGGVPRRVLCGRDQKTISKTTVSDTIVGNVILDSDLIDFMFQNLFQKHCIKINLPY
jgi:hypothetical protein